MPVIQQLAYLGVLHHTVADSDVVSPSNLNRLVGATLDDIDSPKVVVASRMIRAIQPTTQVTALPVDLPDGAIATAIADETVVIGCFDRETPRLEATDICSTVGVPYVDLATEVVPDPTGPVFGGRIVIASDGSGCVSCLDVLDTRELARERMTDEQRQLNDAVYGVKRDALGGSGPSVVTVNSVVASLAATEIMCPDRTATRGTAAHLPRRPRHRRTSARNRPREMPVLLALARGGPRPQRRHRVTAGRCQRQWLLYRSGLRPTSCWGISPELRTGDLT